MGSFPSPPLEEQEKSERTGLLVWTSIILRIVLTLSLWLVLFLGMFLGYFTVPIILVGLVTLLYMLIDIRYVYLARKQTQEDENQNTFDET
jgi:hypothetical protein